LEEAANDKGSDFGWVGGDVGDDFFFSFLPYRRMLPAEGTPAAKTKPEKISEQRRKCRAQRYNEVVALYRCVGSA